MKFFGYGKDGGQDSTVWGFWLVEIKPLFSVALLCFEDGSREALRLALSHLTTPFLGWMESLRLH